jgi:DNA-binding winged helix-turn-helix (wHTH) protein/Tol biopolymer transport system component
MLKAPSATNWQFEGFKVMTEMRLLIAGETSVPLTSKAFDTLVVLIENSGRVVTKDELLRSVWPDVEVEEGNLTQQIFLLRKALGETAQQPRYIVTIPGHGYRFTASVNAISGGPATTVSANGAALPATGPRRGVPFIRTGSALFGVIALAAIVLVPRWMPMEKAGVPMDFTRHVTRITESGKATSSAISRDGRYVAYVENDGDQNSLWVRQVGTEGKAQLVPRQPLAMAHLSFSPDSKYLYFARESPRGPTFTLSRIPVIGGVEMPVLDDVDSPVSFSPDGREFVFQRGTDQGSQIVVAAVGDGSHRILATRKSPLMFSVFAPDWSPDGKVVAASVIDASNGSKSIVLLPVDNSSSRELYTSDSLIGRLRWLPDGSGLLTVISEGREGRLFGRLSGGRIWRIGYPSGRAERLTSDLVDHDPCCLDILANGSAVASVVNTLVSDLWIAPADHLDALEQLTWDHPVLSRHSWLPDNDTMVYHDLSGRLNAVHKDRRVFTLSLPDGQKAAGHISTCGDGRYVVFRAVPGNKIWRVTPNAGGAVRLTNGSNDFNPACSPDGKWVLYASHEADHTSLWRVSIESGSPTPLNVVDSYDVLPSPSGRMIYYSSEAVEEGADRNRPDRWVVMSSTDQTRLFAFDIPDDVTPLPGKLPVWAPDESGLDYVVTRNGVSNIWRQPLTGGPRVQITNFNMGQIFSFAWSPNGRWLSLGIGANRSDVVLMSNER